MFRPDAAKRVKDRAAAESKCIFLPDVWVECEECRGKRYQEEVLAVKLHGRSISDVLDMPIGEAVSLFADQPRLAHILQTICDVGLDYITLGQSAPTLSGGEAQRIKLAAELARPDTGRTLYLLDEPTTGLHFNDIIKLLSVLQRLVDLGNSVVVIEHNLDVIKIADWVIDVGPEAGARGGTIVAQGPPEAIAAHALVAKSAWDKAGKDTRPDDLPSRSYTGEFLAPLLQAGLIEAYLQGRAAASIETPRLVLPPQREVKRPESVTVPSRDALRANRVSARTAESRQSFETAQNAANTPTAGANLPDAGIDPRELNQPWKILGPRWHWTAKGFPNNAQPKWPLELAEKTIAALESIVGIDQVQSPSATELRFGQIPGGQPWATLQTKLLDSLTLELVGPPTAIDLELLQKVGVEGTVEIIDSQKNTRTTLHLKDLKQIRSRNLKTFFAIHWQQTGGK
jgi:excinuclease ABC subunit A